MWKKLMLILSTAVVLLALILAGGAYWAYTHRQMLTEKAMAYAMENVRGKFNPLAAVSKSGSSAKNSGNSEQSAGNGLQNMLGALLGDEGDGAALGQMAQQLLSGLAGNQGNYAAASEEAAPVHDINARDSHGRTLLMNVCRTDASARVVKMILRYGADLEAVDEKGRTALMYAVALNQDPEVVALLVSAGANVKARDFEGKSVRQYAADDEIKALLKK